MRGHGIGHHLVVRARQLLEKRMDRDVYIRPLFKVYVDPRLRGPFLGTRKVAVQKPGLTLLFHVEVVDDAKYNDIENQDGDEGNSKMTRHIVRFVVELRSGGRRKHNHKAPVNRIQRDDAACRISSAAAKVKRRKRAVGISVYELLGVLFICKTALHPIVKLGGITLVKPFLQAGSPGDNKRLPLPCHNPRGALLPVKERLDIVF